MKILYTGGHKLLRDLIVGRAREAGFEIDPNVQANFETLTAFALRKNPNLLSCFAAGESYVNLAENLSADKELLDLRALPYLSIHTLFFQPQPKLSSVRIGCDTVFFLPNGDVSVGRSVVSRGDFLVLVGEYRKEFGDLF